MSKAIGVLETRGMASLLGATDAMLKAADVCVIGRHGIGSGWVTVVVEGDVAAVQTAIAIGRAQAQRHGELIVAEVIARPEARAQDAMPHAVASAEVEIDQRALGLLETQGLAPLIAGADAMAKAADVEVCGWAFIGGALCHVLVRGDVAAVQTAIETGRRAAEKVGTVYATLVLPQPIAGVAPLLPLTPQSTGGRTGALGVVEVIGYAAVVAVADAMVKAAEVDIQRLSIGSGGRISALAVGSLDDVQAAVQAGREMAGQVGGLDGVALVSRPDAATMSWCAFVAILNPATPPTVADVSEIEGASKRIEPVASPEEASEKVGPISVQVLLSKDTWACTDIWLVDAAVCVSERTAMRTDCAPAYSMPSVVSISALDRVSTRGVVPLIVLLAFQLAESV